MKPIVSIDLNLKPEEAQQRFEIFEYSSRAICGYIVSSSLNQLA